MKIFPAACAAAALAALSSVSACVSPFQSYRDTALNTSDRRALAAAVVDGWSRTSALAARRFLAEYGAPDEVRSDHLVWNDRGPWRRTLVRDVRPALVEGDELGVIEQSLECALLPGQAADVAAIDGRVVFDARSGELTARSDREELNFLRMNLADDVANGRLGVAAARAKFARAVALEESGKVVPEMHGLRVPFDL
jgi:hypothetical protein